MNNHSNRSSTGSKPRRYWFAGVPKDYVLPTSSKTLSVDVQELQTKHYRPAELNGNKDILEAKRVTAKTVWEGFSNFTSSHGITQVYSSAGVVKRVAWLILSVISTVFLCIHLTILGKSYTSFTTTTNIELIGARRIAFPAVTICNNNPIKYSELQTQANKNLSDLIDEGWNATVENDDGIPSFRVTYAKLAENLVLLNSSAKFQLGYTRQEMFSSCSFGGQACDFEDFWQFYDSNYGTCYTFNSGNIENATSRYTTLAGSSYGLSLEINVGSYEYIPFLTESEGVQVIVHNSSVMPFPEYTSISVSTGTLSNIALHKKVIKRLNGKYGNCTEQDNSLENMYAIPFNVTYSEWACLRTCFQKELIRQCKCFDANLPYNMTSVVFAGLPIAAAPCSVSVQADTDCMDDLGRQYAARTLQCKQCTQSCYEEQYDTSLSSSFFPAQQYSNNFIQRLRPNVRERLEEAYGDLNHSVIQRNFLKLNVFYDTIGYTLYEQVPSYGDFQFLSDLGGTFGLWVGWSVLTFFEFIGFAADLLVYLCYKKGCCT